jgi:hypothetical protein
MINDASGRTEENIARRVMSSRAMHDYRLTCTRCGSVALALSRPDESMLRFEIAHASVCVCGGEHDVMPDGTACTEVEEI